MAKPTIQTSYLAWKRATSILTTLPLIPSRSHTTTTWRHCSKLLVPSRLALTTSLWAVVAEVSSSCSSISAQSPHSAAWEAGVTTSGSVVWSSITNIFLPSTLVWVSLDISHLWSDPNSPTSTMCTQGMKLSRWLLTGLTLLKRAREDSLFILRSRSNTFASTMSTTLWRNELLSTSLQTLARM